MPDKLAWDPSDTDAERRATLAAAHRIAAVVAQVAVSIANSDRPAVITAWSVRLKTGELIVASHDLLAARRFSHGNSGTL